MKIKIYKHKSIKTPIDDDILKIPIYFNSPFVKQYINEPIIYDVENTSKDYMDDSLFKPNEGKYDTVLFIYEQGTFSIYGQTRMYSKTLNICYASVNPLEDKIDYSWKVFIHELLHSLSYQKGVPNMLDSYYKNDDPYAIDGNFSKQLAVLKPFYVTSSMYKPKNFTIKELVSPVIYAKFGEKSWEFLDERMLRNLQFIRENLGAITVNNSIYQYRGFDACEYRKEGVSQHNMGRAVDFDVKGMTAEEVRQWIIKNQDKLPEPNCWLEVGTSWIHLDTRASEKKGVYSFNA